MNLNIKNLQSSKIIIFSMIIRQKKKTKKTNNNKKKSFEIKENLLDKEKNIIIIKILKKEN